MQRIAIAFTWSVIMAGLAGLVIGLALNEFEINWLYGPIFTLSLTIIHGWIEARHMLLKALGHKEKPFASVTSRGIPVAAGGLVARFESALPGGKTLTLPVEERLTIMTPTGVEISPDEIKHFIGRAWHRQLIGKPPLSRRYWTKQHRPPWDRERYESIIYVLLSSGHIAGRVGGKSGFLKSDYQTIINQIKRGE